MLLQAVKGTVKGRKAESRARAQERPGRPGPGYKYFAGSNSATYIQPEKNLEGGGPDLPCVDPGSCQKSSWQDVWLMAGEKF